MRLLGLTAALTAVTLTAGCGLTGGEPVETPPQAGRVTIDDQSQGTTVVKCTQVDWLLTIEATATPGRAEASLQLGGAKPKVQTVNIQNINGLHGVAGSGTGKAEASLNGDVYVITGTAVGSDSAHPAESKDMPFKIEAPC